MNYRTKRPREGRRSIRLRGYDYRQSGWYFITFCTQERLPLFGRIINHRMHLSPYGHIAKRIWNRGKSIWKNIHLDAFIIMPDHIHAIIQIKSPIVQSTPRVGHLHLDQSRDNLPRVDHPLRADRNIPQHFPVRQTRGETGPTRGVGPTASNTRPNGPKSRSIGAFIGTYKNIVSRTLHNMGLHNEKIWQQNYYERIIRNENELHNVRQYIRKNPQR